MTGILGALQHPVINREMVTTKTNKKGTVKTSTVHLSVTAGEVLMLYILYQWNKAGRPSIREWLLGNLTLDDVPTLDDIRGWMLANVSGAAEVSDIYQSGVDSAIQTAALSYMIRNHPELYKRYMEGAEGKWREVDTAGIEDQETQTGYIPKVIG